MFVSLIIFKNINIFVPVLSPDDDDDDTGSTPGGIYGIVGGSGKGEFGSLVGNKCERFSGK